jgi:integrase
MDEINVIVVDRGRKYLYLRYTDPVTGQKIEKSSGTAKKREAIKAAGEWQSELQSGVAGRESRLKWEAFTEAYQQHVEATLSEGTSDKVFGMFSVVGQLMKPDRVNRITAQWVTTFQRRLLDADRQPATVESHCRHLKAALNWAKDQGWLTTVPKFATLKKAKSAKVMKGRPVTGEEFDRMIAAVDMLPERQRASLKFLLRGLWLSGLRLGEALGLTWDQWADGIRVDTSGEYTVLLIPSEGEKGGKDRTYPITPDFEELLFSIPAVDRSGYVFSPVLAMGVRRRLDAVSRMLTDIGETAGVKVDQRKVRNKETGEMETKLVFASAHDLRRAFGERWARRVMPMVLKELMRHASVTTTEKYYVGINAQQTAKFLREVTLEVTPAPKSDSQRGETSN